jgi:L-ascorbate metabolism protein UlaG (beta-lactamase superfamily)
MNLLDRARSSVAIIVFAACSGAPRPTTKSAENAPTPAPVSVSVSAPSNVELTYLGVAGWQVRHGEHVLLLDPYFTRANVENPDQPLTPNLTQIDRLAPRKAELILVGHSHYDHLLDVPTIAERTHAFVAGTQSTLNVARAAHLPQSQLLLAEPTHPFSRGPFSVVPVASLHSLIGIPNAPIPANIKLPLPAKAYEEGDTLAYLVNVNGLSILFVDTANFIESALAGVHPDVLVAATGLREKIPDYTCRLLRTLGYPKRVLPNHFDAHWEPIPAPTTPIADEQLAEIAKFESEVTQCSPATRVIVPRRFAPITL